jgi:hypothetical protein
MMRPVLCAIFLVSFSPFPTFAQDLGDKPVKLAVPGMTFTRALNGAEGLVKVAGQSLTLRSEAKRANFRDPDGLDQAQPVARAHRIERAGVVQMETCQPRASTR